MLRDIEDSFLSPRVNACRRSMRNSDG